MSARSERQTRDWRTSSVFISGTGTGVGKTFVTAVLAKALQARGFSVGVMKPIETGVMPHADCSSDASYLYNLACPEEDFDVVAPYRLAAPLAPLAASRLEHRIIDFTVIESAHATLCGKYDYVLIEGVGGVLVPVTKHESVRELVIRLKTPCVIVSRAELGAVNHTLLTIEALRRSSIPIIAVIFNHVDPPGDSSSATMQIESTVKLVSALGQLPVLGPLPHQRNHPEDSRAGLTELASNPSITKLADWIVEKHAGTEQ